MGTIIQSIFCAQSGAGIGLNFWKWSGESRYPGALPPLLENFRRAFSPEPTDCPWVSEDEARQAVIETIAVVYQLTKRTQEKLFAYWAKKYKAFFVPNQEPASA